MKPTAPSVDQVESWLLSPLGQSLLRAHEARAAQLLERVFGDVAVQVGSFGPAQSFLRHARLPHRALLAEAGGVGDLQCHAEVLALADRSVDLLLLPHTLEFTDDPLSVLREAERVLNLGGYLWLAGMNPWGYHHVRAQFNRAARLPEQRQVLREGVVKHWLAVLGLSLVRVERFGTEDTVWSRLKPVSGLYQMLVVKKSHALTPIRPRGHRLPTALGSLATPNVRSSLRRLG